MEGTVIDCPNCSKKMTLGTAKCPSCRKQVIIFDFESISDSGTWETNKYINSYSRVLREEPDNKTINLAIAICFLKVRQYDRAKEALDKAIKNNLQNSKAFYYAAICMLNGKNAFLAPRSAIDKALENISSAVTIEPRGIYSLLAAYIKYDYFFRKSYSVTPDYRAELLSAKKAGYTVCDAARLFRILGVEKPAVFD